MDENCVAAFMVGLAIREKVSEIRVPMPAVNDGERFSFTIHGEGGEPGAPSTELVLKVVKSVAAPLFPQE